MDELTEKKNADPGVLEPLKMSPEYVSLCIPLASEEYESLKESIRKDGLWIPLVVNPDGVVLDGHHRYRACGEVDRPWDDPKPIVKRFDSKLLEKKFIIETNLKRRHLTTLQKVEMAMKLEPIEAELARHRQEATRIKDGKPPGEGQLTTTVKGKTREIVAKKVGLSGKTYQRAKKVLEAAPEELIEWVKEGDLSVSRAYRMINSPVSKKRLEKILEKAPEELKEKFRQGKVSINHAYVKIIQQERHEAAHSSPEPLPKSIKQALLKHPLARPGWSAWGLVGQAGYLDTDEGCWRADWFPDRGRFVGLSYAIGMAKNDYFSRLERIKQSLIWNYLYDLPEEDITRFVAKVNSKARERVEYVADHILIMNKENREIINRRRIFKDKIEELYAKFKQVTVEFTDGTTIPLNLKLLDWDDFLYRKYKKGGRKWVESSLKLNILPALAKEMLGFDERGRLLERLHARARAV